MMHDPMSIAHEIKYPWKHTSHFNLRDGTPTSYTMRDSFVTIWHRDPSGYDSGERCRWNGRWRWHIHHWRLQVHPYQRIRTAFDRCIGCGKRFGMSPGARIGAGWDNPDSYHHECYSKARTTPPSPEVGV